MLGPWRGLNTQLLYTAGIQGSPARAALTESDTDHLRDAIKHLERALTTSQAVPPSTRFLLARSYASIGDAHNAARHYRWMRDNLTKFLKSCAEETGTLWNTEFGTALLIGIHECLVNAYDHAEELDNAISAANDWIASCPEHPGTFDRMARLFQKRGDFAAAYEWLRKEEERNPSFGEDPNISLALALGGTPAGFQLDKLLKDLPTSRPHEYSLVESVVQTHWASFAKLQPESKKRWATGAWLLSADMPHPPDVAAQCFSWAVERELRSAVFAAFAEHTKKHPGLLDSDTDERTKIFSRYLKGYPNITLGQMLTTLEGALRWQSHLTTQLAQWLKSEHPQLLSKLPGLHTDRISELRNRAVHGVPQTITTAEAQEMATLCQGLISALHPTP
jgi:tetratricopeptide (TPR) repeat protein